jgi:hypothetical protein
MDAKPRRRRDSGDICQLRVELWAGIKAASAMVEDADTTPMERLRAISALSMASSVYLKIHEAVELETRLAAVERAMLEERR